MKLPGYAHIYQLHQYYWKAVGVANMTDNFTSTMAKLMLVCQIREQNPTVLPDPGRMGETRKMSKIRKILIYKYFKHEIVVIKWLQNPELPDIS